MGQTKGYASDGARIQPLSVQADLAELLGGFVGRVLQDVRNHQPLTEGQCQNQ